jgi:hypothetical protein
MEKIKGGRRMTDERNIKLNDEIMASVAGGDDEEKGRTRHAIVRGIHEHPYYKDMIEVTLDGGQDVIAHYDAINVINPGTEVIVELVGQGRWKIIEIL